MEKVSIVSPVASVRFPHLTNTESYSGVDSGKYALTLIFDPKDRKALDEAITKSGGGKGKSPLKEIPQSGDYDPGMLMLKAKTTNISWVKAVDKEGAAVPLEDITHGSDVRVKLTFAPYEMSGGGVTCYLGSIQLLNGAGGNTDFGPLPEGYEPGSDQFDDPIPGF